MTDTNENHAMLYIDLGVTIPIMSRTLLYHL